MKKRYLVEVDYSNFYVCSDCKKSLQKQFKEGIIEQFRIKVIKNCSNEKCYSCELPVLQGTGGINRTILG